MLLFPRFFGQSPLEDGVSPEFHSELVLINLTGGRLFDATVLFAIFNDNEVPLVGRVHFPLLGPRAALGRKFGISNMFDDSFLRNATDDDPGEVFGAPANFPETGWFTVDGATADSTATSFPDPAILGVLIDNDKGEERSGGSRRALRHGPDAGQTATCSARSPGRHDQPALIVEAEAGRAATTRGGATWRLWMASSHARGSHLALQRGLRLSRRGRRPRSRAARPRRPASRRCRAARSPRRRASGS
jgi:hypothetical protein